MRFAHVKDALVGLVVLSAVALTGMAVARDLGRAMSARPASFERAVAGEPARDVGLMAAR
jgi:hypothetical protein